MKLPKLHEYYTVNIVLYLILAQTLLLVSGYNWLNAVGPLPFIAYFIFGYSFLFITPINILLILVEFLLRKFQLIKSKNLVNLTNKQKKIIYIAGAVCFIICLTYICYEIFTPPKYPYSEYD